MQINAYQLAAIRDKLLIEKLDRSFSNSLPKFVDWNKEQREYFLSQCVEVARVLGLTSELGMASYGLGAWWLNLGFEQQSQLLVRLLSSALPEIRKVLAMNGWIRCRLNLPTEPNAADQALRAAINETSAWGTR